MSQPGDEKFQVLRGDSSLSQRYRADLDRLEARDARCPATTEHRLFPEGVPCRLSAHARYTYKGVKYCHLHYPPAADARGKKRLRTAFEHIKKELHALEDRIGYKD